MKECNRNSDVAKRGEKNESIKQSFDERQRIEWLQFHSALRLQNEEKDESQEDERYDREAKRCHQCSMSVKNELALFAEGAAPVPALSRRIAFAMTAQSTIAAISTLILQEIRKRSVVDGIRKNIRGVDLCALAVRFSAELLHQVVGTSLSLKG